MCDHFRFLALWAFPGHRRVYCRASPCNDTCASLISTAAWGQRKYHHICQKHIRGAPRHPDFLFPVFPLRKAGPFVLASLRVWLPRSYTRILCTPSPPYLLATWHMSACHVSRMDSILLFCKEIKRERKLPSQIVSVLRFTPLCFP
jgi:hypothetical protein